MTLTEFLLAQIAEDEAVARAATLGPWGVDDESYAEAIYGADLTSVVSGGRWGDGGSVFNSTRDAVHIARHDPARVLAECEVKRRIVEYLVCAVKEKDDPAIISAYTDVVEQLAVPYADHPDYRESWRP